ncbi:hypothetical protein niasHS_018196 [Heterodera schachtii]|uniref:SPARK domain-containing protein n=1 Tax=Heterodera schachtii TaxID=97005 RepID=A0ABD2HS08_HETSC
MSNNTGIFATTNSTSTFCSYGKSVAGELSCVSGLTKKLLKLTPSVLNLITTLARCSLTNSNYCPAKRMAFFLTQQSSVILFVAALAAISADVFNINDFNMQQYFCARSLNSRIKFAGCENGAATTTPEPTQQKDPCCIGSESFVWLLANNTGIFDVPNSTSMFCSYGQSVAGELNAQLVGCTSGGEINLLSNLVSFLHANSEDKCSHSLGFVRAMFAIVASTPRYANNKSEWLELRERFGQQTAKIDAKCAKFGVVIAKMLFNSDKTLHEKVLENGCFFCEHKKDD